MSALTQRQNSTPVYEPSDYVAVAALQTGTVCGSTKAAVGNYLAGVLIVPETTSPGSVTIIDGSTSQVIFQGGASSVSNLIPFFAPFGASSQSGAWSITTGANVHVFAIGIFT